MGLAPPLITKLRHKYLIHCLICVVLHGICRWTSPLPSIILPLYEFISHFVVVSLQLCASPKMQKVKTSWSRCPQCSVIISDRFIKRHEKDHHNPKGELFYYLFPMTLYTFPHYALKIKDMLL